MVESRDYLTAVKQTGQRSASFNLRLAFSRESMRLTARLIQVMAWLLAQKAVQAGEISLSTAADVYGLSGRDVCLAHDESANAALPATLRNLLERSYRLYVRVSRLDEMVRRESGIGQ